MNYAITDSQSVTPFPKGRAKCPCCQRDVIAKCGKIKIWHWSHSPERHCDDWWEGETEWHRNWKAYFPVANQEVVHFDPETGEKHIADIKCNDGLVVELQNSPISIDELQSREAFYKNLIWIVNGDKFKESFHISPFRLPPPNSSLADDLDILRPPFFNKRQNGFLRPIIMKKSMRLDTGTTGIISYDLSGYLVASGGYNNPEKVLDEIDQVYRGHHFFDWNRPRKEWLAAARPIFIDFGGEVLFHLAKFNERFHCVLGIDRSALIKTLQGESQS